MHDLRHTVRMRLREAGVPESTGGDILWHSRPRKTAHYSVAQAIEIREALELITGEKHATTYPSPRTSAQPESLQRSLLK